MSSGCRRRSITACISVIRRCACTRWASAASTRKRDRGRSARSWRMPSTEAIRAGALGFSTSRATTHIRPGRRPRRQPHRRLGGDRPARRRDGRAQFRHLPDRPRHLRRRGAARVSRPAAQGGARQRAPDHVRHPGDQAGQRPEPVGLPAALDRRDRRAGRTHLGPGDDALDQRDLLAAIVSAVRLPAGMARAPRAAARRAEGAAARSRDAAPSHFRGGRT